MTAMRALAFAMVLAAALPAHAISDPAEMLPDAAQEDRAEQIGRQLRCLVCQNESIEDSGADLARDLRAIVRQRVGAGDTDGQVTAWMVARYGDFVRLRPPFTWVTAVLWLSPLLALSAGVGAALLGRRRTPAGPVPLDDSETSRIAELTR